MYLLLVMLIILDSNFFLGIVDLNALIEIVQD